MSILLGFEIGSGARVEVPSEGHSAVFGQTQLSGKTTAIEAMVYRGNFRAIAFITKRGEGSFLTARVIPPFFSEPTNDPERPLWRWVKSILEASQSRRMNFEEAWIIRACEEPRHAMTLADVHRNISAQLKGERAKSKRGKEKWLRKPVGGINANVYTSLSAYFDIVMPQLAKLPYSKTLDLPPGLSVMDLREYSLEMQALVIRSSIEHVYRHERNVRVIVPEAWQFVPEHRNTPVKMACETLVRMGAADKNFLWLDSQDMAAVDKAMLRACSVVCCGVQRELNEIDRTIESLFHGEITPRHIGSLKIGQFYVCLPGGEVRKVYVQPSWIDSELHAQAIARGEESVESARPMLKAFEKERESEDDAMWKQQYDTLKTQHAKLQNDYANVCAAHDALVERVRLLEGRIPAPVLPDARERDTGAGTPGGKSAAAVEKSSQQARANAGEGEGLAAAVPSNGSNLNGHDLDDIYLAIKERAAKDPGVLELLLNRPELHVKVSRPKITAHGDKLDGQIATLLKDGFFEKPQDRQAIGGELRRRGWLSQTANLKILSPFLSKFAAAGFLTIEGAGLYQAVPGMAVHISEQ